MEFSIREVNVPMPQTIMEDTMGFELQTITVGLDNRTYYNAYVVCKQLGYVNATQTLENVPSCYIKKFNELKAGGGTLIPWLDRRGLQWLVLGCRKKSAEHFKKWVIEEVLESVYTNGGYIMGQEKLEDSEKEQLLIQIRKLAEDNKALIEDNKQLRKDNAIREKAYSKLENRILDIANDLNICKLDEKVF